MRRGRPPGASGFPHRRRRAGQPYRARAARGSGGRRSRGLRRRAPHPAGPLEDVTQGPGRFRIEVEGRPAHAGTNLREGASAVEELAQQMIRVHALTDHERGVSVNVGTISGGTAENVVAAYAEARLDVRVTHAADVQAVEQALHSLEPVVAGTTIAVRAGGRGRRWCRHQPHASCSPKLRSMGARSGSSCRKRRPVEARTRTSSARWGVPVLDGLGAEAEGLMPMTSTSASTACRLRARLLARLLEDPGL